MHAHSLCLPSPVIIPVSHWIGYQTALFYTYQLFVRYKRETCLPGVRGIFEEDTMISEEV